MGQLLNLFWDICRLRRGPQDLPFSPSLLLMVCALFLGLQLAIGSVLGIQEGSFSVGVLSLVFNFGALYLLLTLRGLSNRFVQTALALLCCAVLFTVLNLPIELSVVGTKPLAPEQLTPVQMLLVLASLPLLIWKLMIDAHILRHGLNVPFLVGMAIAVLWLVAELALISLAGAAPAAA
jgi:hypothetical protein